MHPALPGAAARALRRLCFVLPLVAAACSNGGGGTDTDTDPDPPVISGVQPAAVLQWDPDFTITVNGTGFVAGAVVRWNGSARPTTFVSASQLTAEIANEDVHQVGPAQVSVINPGSGGTSNTMNVMVQSPAPRVVGLNPWNVVRATGAFTLVVHGEGFSQNSVVRWNGADRPTTFRHAGELAAQIPNSDLQTAGTVQVSVFTPAPGGGLSNTVDFTVQVPPNPPATVTGISPNSIVRGVGGTITVTGNWFIPATRVQIAGMATEPAVTWVSQTEIRFTLTPADILPPAASVQVSVFNPAPGGGGAQIQLQVTDPVPVLTGLFPAQAVLGQTSQVVRITGTGFLSDSYIRYDDEGRGWGYISPTELELTLEARDLDEAGTFPITVTNFGLGGGISNTLDFTVVNPAPTP